MKLIRKFERRSQPLLTVDLGTQKKARTMTCQFFSSIVATSDSILILFVKLCEFKLQRVFVTVYLLRVFRNCLFFAGRPGSISN
jgi:hypothetical protein